ncbi:hypothetical protein pb186bvf_006570 [Paramecium bursaria]
MKILSQTFENESNNQRQQRQLVIVTFRKTLEQSHKKILFIIQYKIQISIDEW